MDPSGELADTHLAEVLHATGRLPADQLQEALELVRARRKQDPQASLAGFLESSGVIQSSEVVTLLRSSQTWITPVAAAGGDTLVDSLHGASSQGQGRWRVGKRIGNYELEELLGRGGVGVVFRARHVGTGQGVALKGLLIDDEESVERFAREALALASLDRHPNVAEVYESGQVDGKPFLALELISGGDLFQILRVRTRLPGPEAAAAVAGLASGLAHVHAQGTLHRDLKPANVLFTTEGVPKLVDFGMARLDRAERMTQTGQILGTPAYMAPEQAMGLKEVDARSDVYGLGAILYHVLTGLPPFQGSTSMEVLSRVLTEEPPRPSSIVPDLDRRLEAICLKALAKDPPDRFQSASELGAALEEWSPASTEALPTERRLTLLGTVAGLAVGVALGAILGLKAGKDSKAGTEPSATAPSQVEIASSSPTPTLPPSPSPSPSSSPSPSPSPSPSSSPSSSPGRRASPGPRSATPTRIATRSLKRGSAVMIELMENPRFPNSTAAQLGWVVSLPDEAQPKARFLVAGGHVVAVHAPRAGFRPDGFGTGARVWIKGKKRDATIALRRGPVALVEERDHTRKWRHVSSLTLLGPGVDPGSDAEAKIHLAPWTGDKTLYPAVVVNSSRDAKGRVLVAYLEDGLDWIHPEALRPLPSPGEALTFGKSGTEEIQGRVVSYLHPAVVEIAPEGDRDGRIQAEVLWIYVTSSDRKR